MTLKICLLHFFLIKALIENGLGEYKLALGKSAFSPPGETCLSKPLQSLVVSLLWKIDPYPYLGTPIQEVWLEVNGAPLIIFNNHWPSGTEYESERFRVSAAEILNKRVSEIVNADPNADIIIGGDFNTNIDQEERKRKWPKTVYKSVLGNSSSEKNLLKTALSNITISGMNWRLQRGSVTFIIMNLLHR